MAWNNYILEGKDNNETKARVNSDVINHPKHYMVGNGLETIDIIAGATADASGFEGYCLGNAIKYLTRYKKKNGLEDLYKARWYVNKLIEINE